MTSNSLLLLASLFFFPPCLRRVSVDGNSTLQLAFNDIIIYEDERQGSLADVSGCCCCVLSVVRDSLVSVGNQTFGRRDSERWENLFNGRHSSRERKISSSIYSQAEQENAVEKIFFFSFSTVCCICGAFIFLFFVCWREGGIIFLIHLCCWRAAVVPRDQWPWPVLPAPCAARCTRKSFCLMRFVIRKHRKT